MSRRWYEERPPGSGDPQGRAKTEKKTTCPACGTDFSKTDRAHLRRSLRRHLEHQHGYSEQRATDCADALIPRVGPSTHGEQTAGDREVPGEADVRGSGPGRRASGPPSMARVHRAYRSPHGAV